MNACAVVLDTNVVLDWLWFADARLSALGAAVEDGRLHWLASEAMREELHRVLQRPTLPPRGRTPAQVLQAFDRWARPAAAPPQDAGRPPWMLRCTDPDDQKFIDLAMQQRAGWLFTRDRAVLRLARHARRLGCVFAPPEAWAPGAA